MPLTDDSHVEQGVSTSGDPMSSLVHQRMSAPPLPSLAGWRVFSPAQSFYSSSNSITSFLHISSLVIPSVEEESCLLGSELGPECLFADRNLTPFLLLTAALTFVYVCAPASNPLARCSASSLKSGLRFCSHRLCGIWDLEIALQSQFHLSIVRHVGASFHNSLSRARASASLAAAATRSASRAPSLSILCSIFC